MISRIINIFSHHLILSAYKRRQFFLILASIFFAFGVAQAELTISQEPFEYFQGGRAYVGVEINGIPDKISALGIKVTLPEGLTYKEHSTSAKWRKEKPTQDGFELALSEMPDDDHIYFYYYLSASLQLDGIQTIQTTLKYRIGDDLEQEIDATPLTLSKATVHGFHEIDKCQDDHSSVVNTTIQYEGQVTALGVRLLIAENTEFYTITGETYQTKIIDTTTIELYWKTIPASPVNFNYLLSRIGAIDETADIQTQILYRIGDGTEEKTIVSPNPIPFPQCEEFTIIADVSPSEAGLITPSGTITVNLGESVTYVTKPNDGYKSLGWMVDGKLDQNAPFPQYVFRDIDTDHQITAMYERIQYQIDFDENIPNGSITSSTGSDTVLHGDSITLTIKPAPGYEVASIQKNETTITDMTDGGNIVFENVTDNTNKLAVTFTRKHYEVTVTHNEFGTVELNGETKERYTVLYGDDLIFNFIPNSDDYVVEQVNVNDIPIKLSDNSYEIPNVQKNYSIHAIFKEFVQSFDVTINHNEGGTVKPSGTMTLFDGEVLTIYPMPDEGYTVSEVKINDIVLSEPYQITVNETQIIHVTFESSVGPPEAQFSYEISETDSLQVSFLDESEGIIQEWLWDFGDGVKKKEINPTHTYSSGGTYNVVLTVTGPGDSSSSYTETIKVTEPVKESVKVSFLATTTVGPPPLEVSFFNLSEIKDTVTVTSWQWDFGDGHSLSSDTFSETIAHEYTKSGNYTVTLTAETDTTAYSFQKQNYIKVSGKKITGTVTASDTKSGLRDCIVEVYIQSNATAYPLFFASALTNENGEYSIEKLPASADLIISAWPPLNNNRYAGEFFENQTSADSAMKISTISENPIINFELANIPQLGIIGRILESGQGQPDTEVSVLSMSTYHYQTTISDSEGFYTFTHLLDVDDYRVYVWSETLHSDVYYDTQNSSVLSWELATPVKPIDGYTPEINIHIDPQQTDSIKGVVRLKEDNTPISNIWVNAWSDELNIGNGAYTDESGAYTIVGLQKTNTMEEGYIVEIDSSNDLYPYQAYNETEDRKNAIKVAPGITGIDFNLKTGNTLNGKVVDENGNPLKNVNINTWSLSKEFSNSATTNAAGRYSIPNLPPADDYIVSASSDQYPVQYYYHQNKQENADHVDLSTGNVFNINFKMDKGAVITGKIIVEDGQPGNIFVNVWSETDERLHTQQSDTEGNYTFIGLNPNIADYLIYVWEDNYLRAFYNKDGTKHKWEEATLVAPSSISREIRLSKGLTIQGKITSSDNRIIANARVEAWNESDQFFADDVSTSKSPQGYNYQLTGLPENTTYTILVSHENYLDTSATFILGENDITDANIALEDQEPRKISGHILQLDEGDTVFVKVRPKGSTDIKMKAVKSDGQQQVPFSFTGLKPAANYILDILPTAKYPYVAYDGAEKIQDAKSIDISQDNKTDIVLNLDRNTKTISGTITFPENAMGHMVWVYAWSIKLQAENQTSVENTGNNEVRYTITGLRPSDDYMVSVDSNIYQQQFFYNANTLSDATRIDLTNDETQDDIDFTLHKGVSISGTIYSKNDEPLDNVHVEAWSASKDSLGFSTSESDGSFSIGGLQNTDDYLVYILHNQTIMYYHSDGIVSSMSRAERISTLIESPTGIDITLIQTQSISGIVRDTQNMGLENVMVTASSFSTGALNGSITDRLGRYTIQSLPVGDDYQVTATPGSDMNYEVQIKSNVQTNSSNINFSLISGYKIAGVVKDWQENPLENVRVEITSLEKSLDDYTDEKGQYCIQGISSGDNYYFLAMPPSGSELMDYFEKNIVIDAHNESKNITLRRASKIDGTVVNAENTNNKIPDVMLTIYSATHAFWTHAMTNYNGYYCFDNLPDADDYVIKVVSDHYQEKVVINRSSGETINFELKPAVILNGILINMQTGAGIENAVIEVRYQGEIIKETLTDDSGKFVATGLPKDINEYLVIAKYSGYPDVQEKWLTSKADQQLILQMSRSAKNVIKGYVQDANGNPPPLNVDVQVRLYHAQHRRGFIQTYKCSSEDGSFVINGLNQDKGYHLKFVEIIGNQKLMKEWLDSDNGFYGSTKRPPKTNHVKPGGEDILFKFNQAW